MCPEQCEEHFLVPETLWHPTRRRRYGYRHRTKSLLQRVRHILQGHGLHRRSVLGPLKLHTTSFCQRLLRLYMWTYLLCQKITPPLQGCCAAHSFGGVQCDQYMSKHSGPMENACRRDEWRRIAFSRIDCRLISCWGDSISMSSLNDKLRYHQDIARSQGRDWEYSKVIFS